MPLRYYCLKRRVIFSLETVPVIPAEQEILQVESNGIVSVSKPVIVSNYCPMQIKNFPFDEQECPLIISPWGYTARQVTVYDSGSAIEMRGNSEWNADCARFNENIVQVKLNLYKELQYGLHFKRNPTYYVWVLILPTYLITCLSIVGIFMPNSSSGERIEKVTLGLATLLTMAVILNIVSEAMPKGADLPMLGYFVMAEIVLCIISLIVAIVIIQVHHRVSTRTHPPPEWLFTILLLTKTEQWAVKPPDNRSLSGSQIASNVIVLGKRTVSKQKSLRREPSVNTWTTSLPSDTEKTTAVPPHCASDDMRQMVTELRAYLAKLNQDEAIVGQWIRIFDRIDAVFLTTLQITNFVVSVFLLT
uniref:Uncharacterized protein n=1 Tax=Plectus sambesii TaxID=2011161 RepID=A0A914X834_9BILA